MQMPLLHRRLAAFVGLSLLLLLASGFIPNGPADNAVKLATPLPELPSDLQTGGIHVNSGLPEPVLADQEPPNVVKKKEIVRNGDSMALIFARNDFSPRALYALTQTKHGDTLNGIFPGAELTFESNGGRLTTLTYLSLIHI